MRLTVLIHRAETFYFDNYDMWQQRLGADLLRQYTDSDYDRDPADNVFVELGIRSLEDVLREARERELAFVSDERLDRFWAETADRLKERVG